eukprot:CAMPEP_0116119398 /NCGR_PEP_ID=MMETSP0329-20121206/2616_1 /TAXON_ID=697910 /ORGANISM="Pseudo-nitzschia arenysensis, Strain B593" /LENGTH=201 /DNA_ID=CAMNT_0003613089 /DNA_START=6 /DNA_END=608 /DNA_ORIENTATION=+
MTLWNNNENNTDEEINNIGDSRQEPLLHEDETHEIEIYHEHDGPVDVPAWNGSKPVVRPTFLLRRGIRSHPGSKPANSKHPSQSYKSTKLDPFFYAIMFGSLLIPALPSYFYSCWYFVFLLVGIGIVNYNYNTIHREYQTEVYRPSIERILEELEGPLEEAGYSAQVVAKISWGGNGFTYRSILEFTKLEGEDRWDVEKMA